MPRHLKCCRSQPHLGEPEVDHIPEIHRIGNSVGDKIQPEEKFLISFPCIDDNRDDAQQNKQGIDIQNSCGIKCDSVIGKAEIIRDRINFYQIPVKVPKQKPGSLIEKIG